MHCDNLCLLMEILNLFTLYIIMTNSQCLLASKWLSFPFWDIRLSSVFLWQAHWWEEQKEWKTSKLGETHWSHLALFYIRVPSLSGYSKQVKTGHLLWADAAPRAHVFASGKDLCGSQKKALLSLDRSSPEPVICLATGLGLGSTHPLARGPCKTNNQQKKNWGSLDLSVSIVVIEKLATSLCAASLKVTCLFIKYLSVISLWCVGFFSLTMLSMWMFLYVWKILSHHLFKYASVTNYYSSPAGTLIKSTSGLLYPSGLLSCLTDVPSF